MYPIINRLKKIFLILTLMLLTKTIFSQNKNVAVELSFGLQYLDIGNFKNPEYFELSNQTVNKLFSSFAINPKITIISKNNIIFSFNQTNYGKYTEGETKINSKISAVGLGLGYDLSGNILGEDSFLGEIINLGVGLQSEVRLNYNYKYEGVKITFTGDLASQITTKDDIEKFTPEMSLYPNISLSFIDDIIRLNTGISFHGFLTPKLGDKIITSGEGVNFKAFNQNNRIAIMFMPRISIRISF